MAHCTGTTCLNKSCKPVNYRYLERRGSTTRRAIDQSQKRSLVGGAAGRLILQCDPRPASKLPVLMAHQASASASASVAAEEAEAEAKSVTLPWRRRQPLTHVHSNAAAAPAAVTTPGSANISVASGRHDGHRNSTAAAASHPGPQSGSRLSSAGRSEPLRRRVRRHAAGSIRAPQGARC